MKNKSENAQEYMGQQLIVLLAESMHKAEKETYQLLADLTSLTVEQVADLNLADLKDIVMQMVPGVPWGELFQSPTTELE